MMRICFISIPLIPSMLITFTGNLSYLYVRTYIYIYIYYTHIPQTTPFAPKVPVHHLDLPSQVRQGEAQDVLGPPLLRPGP